MKKIFSTLVFAILTIGLFAQAKKYPLALHFTNSNCGNCAASNPSFFKKIDAYPKDIHHITIHPKFPYQTCVFYNANITDNTSLVSLFSADFTPSVSFNGVAPTGVSSTTDAQLKTLIAQTSPVSINVKETTGANRTVTVSTKSVGTVPAANYTLYAAVVEKVVNKTTGNGEAVHRDVLRKLLTPTGVNFTPAASGKDATNTFTYAVDASWIDPQVYTIVWIQDGNKNILNSGSRFDPSVATEELLVDESIKVFPNPSSDYLNVDLSEISQNPEKISIYGLDGSLLAEFAAQKEVNRLNISELNAGTFIVKIKTDKGFYTQIGMKK
jgi:hypothetical protein